jgi:hypothetical protein
MKTINIFNIEIVIFIIVVIISILFISFYNIIKPEDTLGYNFTPYAQFSPKDLPDNNLNAEEKSCWTTLTACDEYNQCPSCNSDFTCTQVDVDGQYIFQNQSVPEGQWCLPENNSRLCNTYTGSWVWVDEPGYCSNLDLLIENPGLLKGGRSNQCWKCMAKYPNLYVGPDAGQKIQAHAKIVATETAAKDTGGLIRTGQVWDPNPDSEDIDSEYLGSDNPDLDILRYSPYKSVNGQPYFKYECDYGYSNLPGDPFRCHPDLCYKKNPDSENEYGPIPLKKDPQGNYFCDCNQLSGFAEIPDGDLKGKCFNPAKEGCASWNPITKDCGECNVDCGGQFCKQVKCKSDYINKDLTNNCKDNQNPIGYECQNICPNIRCQNGVTQLKIDGNDNCSCNCSTIDPNVLKQFIDLNTSYKTSTPNYSNWGFKDSDQTCQYPCAKSGEIAKSELCTIAIPSGSVNCTITANNFDGDTLCCNGVSVDTDGGVGYAINYYKCI